ncbi:MAG TPA: hypothetical protein VK638_41745, partial [Edaphobacter sp.]|nr:hypothetical protein [Edaphobacter sp.]
AQKLDRFGVLSPIEAYLCLFYAEARSPGRIAQLGPGALGSALRLGKMSGLEHPVDRGELDVGR